MRSKLGIEVRKNIDRYLNLNILDKKVRCPYYINYVEAEFLALMVASGIEEEKVREVHKRYKGNEANYGWYRGKGTPEELENASLEIAKRRGFNLSSPTPEGIRELMRILGLGIDCSGYIYNVFLLSFRSLGLEDEFIQSLAWVEEGRYGASRASVGVFSGDASTLVEDLDSLEDLDLVLLKDREGEYLHIAMILKEKDGLKITQAQFSTNPSGVATHGMDVVNGVPSFGFKSGIGSDWRDLYSEGRIEFRRLKVVRQF